MSSHQIFNHTAPCAVKRAAVRQPSAILGQSSEAREAAKNSDSANYTREATALSKLCETEAVFYAYSKRQCRSLAPTPSKANAAKVWVVYQKNMRKTMLLTGCALLLGTTVIASDFAADPLSFRNPQQDLFGNLSEMLREMKELQSC